MKYYIYLITRSDGQLYVGTTDSKNIKNRMYGHKRSNRFEGFTFKYKIIAQSEDEKIHDLEEYYITKYDSFQNGLNESKDGKGNHLAPNFTTKGFKFSDASRKKMSVTRKRLLKEGKIKMPYFIPNEEKRLQLSKKRKGIQFAPLKFSDIIMKQLKNLYKSRPKLKSGFICKNGKIMNYERAFAKKYGPIFKMTPNFVFNFLTGKTRTNVNT